MRRHIVLQPVAAALLAACGGSASSPVTSEGQSAQGCVSCHGSGGSSAPPRTTRGATATTDRGVGAHATHLEPGSFRKAVACEECHPVPKVNGDPGHGDGAVDVVFGPLTRTGGETPTWDRATATCSGTYCHGATLAGGTRTAPVWTRVVRDETDPTSEVYCGACHGIPPDASSGHPVVDATIPGFTLPPNPAVPSTLAVCATCHPGVVREDGRIDVDGGRHIDRVVQVGAFACARCHGDPGDTTRDVALRAAPPSGLNGERATTDRAVGAHAVHLLGTDLTEAAVGCIECHAVPASMRDHPNRVVELTWGPLASAGGATPRWNAGTLTCSSTYCHGSTLTGGTDTAPVWTRVDGTQARCTSCHGMPPATAAHAGDPGKNPNPTDCNRCHAGYSATGVVKETHLDGLVNVTDPAAPSAGRTCTGCHGDARRSPGFLRPAPPAAIGGATATTARGVGAHLAHLTGDGLSAVPVACGECHPAQTRTDHAARNGYALQLRFGPLASAGQSYPEYDPGTLTCTNTYCHGSTLAGGTRTAPVWNQVTGDPSARGSQVACGSCHGIPPPAPHVANTDCGTCHTGYTATTLNLALHLDGSLDVAGGSCTTCHGDPARSPASVAPAPPAEARVATGTAPWAGDGATGAHLEHLVAGPLAPAIACKECHRPITSAPQRGGGDGHGDGQATLVFGALATTDGARPSFDARTLTCSSTYCHGATLTGGTLTAPVWTRTDGSQVACGTCHGVPPADTAHAAVAKGVSCGDCHGGYGGTQGGAAGTFTVNKALHVNGLVDASGGSCTSCHGTSGRRLVAGADDQAAAAPPADAAGFSGAAGAHLAHLNQSVSPLAAPIACGECHPAVTSAPRRGGDPHGDGKATVVFGALATADGASPSFAAGTCSNTYCHGATMAGGTQKAPAWTRTDGTQAACGTCHGVPPPDTAHAGVAKGTSCGGCHAGYTATTVNVAAHVDGKVESSAGTCTSCHGDASRASALAPAPPAEAGVSSGTAPWAGDGASGAHLEHLVAGALGPAVACAECHTVPTAPRLGGTHGDGKATLVFGAKARTGGATPSFDASTLRCSGTYCHGATMSGGTATAPIWTRTDGSQVACGGCHAAVPADSLHAGLASGTACKGCHAGYGGTKGAAAGTLTVNAALHLNGKVDASGGTCTSCHGTQGRTLLTGADAQTASAPPASAAGFSVPGAHLAHLNKGTGAVGRRVACSQCHAVPAASPRGGTDTHGDARATVVFGSLARTGGKSPSFDATTLTCSSTYCHGSASVRWNAGSQSCTACHALPPNDACHTFRHEENNGACNGCHRNTNGSGTAILDITKHVDGVLQGKCTDCHRKNLSCTNTGDDDD